MDKGPNLVIYEFRQALLNAFDNEQRLCISVKSMVLNEVKASIDSIASTVIAKEKKEYEDSLKSKDKGK